MHNFFSIYEIIGIYALFLYGGEGIDYGVRNWRGIDAEAQNWGVWSLTFGYFHALDRNYVTKMIYKVIIDKFLWTQLEQLL